MCVRAFVIALAVCVHAAVALIVCAIRGLSVLVARRTVAVGTPALAAASSERGARV